MVVDVGPAILTARQTNLDTSTTTEDLKSEVLWVLKIMNSHYSYKSSEDVARLLQAMFFLSDLERSLRDLYVMRKNAVMFAQTD